MLRLVFLMALIIACADVREEPESGDWYHEAFLDVEEPVAFTDVPYGFTGSTPIADLPRPALGSFTTWFESELINENCDGWQTSTELPRQIEGVVTLHPRFYFKTSGCRGSSDADSDEKFYGSYFIEDDSGGLFVLGDSKVAHFDMGQRVRLLVRAVKENFDMQMVAAHDVLAIERAVEPIYYQWADGPLGPDDVSEVRRVSGIVLGSTTNFGEFTVEAEDGSLHTVKLDWEITRRKHRWETGSSVTVTGPVLFSYDVYAINVMRVGQIQTHDSTEPTTP